ncbi:MAG: hypothetical protein KJ749_06955, partial [Planctomycetes bacterium]|nr:hypothetical protein [Planctomycetota bacterium]
AGYTCESCTGPTLKTISLPYKCVYGDSVSAPSAMRCTISGTGCSEDSLCGVGQGSCVETFVACDPTLSDESQCWYDPVFMLQETCQLALGTRVSVPFHGDSTWASLGAEEGDKCAWQGEDDSWWEGVVIPNLTPGTTEEATADDCAYLVVDLCCNPYIPTRFYFVSRTGDTSVVCTPSTWLSPDIDEFGEVTSGPGDACNNEVCCGDGNSSVRYTVPPGSYRYMIYDRSVCNGANAGPCEKDQDCADGGDGDTCVPHKREYKGHFSIEPCPLAACCTGSDCTITNRLYCEDDGTLFPGKIEGVWLGEGAVFHPTVVCNADPGDVCEFGACCIGPGNCRDDITTDGMTEAECLALPVHEYLGGITCENSPCPVCAFEDDLYCQLEDPESGSMYFADRNREDGGVRLADDFTPLSGSITHICWSPGFYNPYTPAECATLQAMPSDDWLVRFFADGGGIPGAEIGPPGGRHITPTEIQAKVRQGAQSRLWDYQAYLPTPVTVSTNVCYWMEISGFGKGENACTTYISTGGPDNRYAFADSNGDGLYDPDEFDTFDLRFCLQLAGGFAPYGCGDTQGACCTCPGICDFPKTAYDCVAALDATPPGMEGVWYYGEYCVGAEPLECPGVPGNDNCENATVITGLDAKGSEQIAYDNICATDDGSGTLSEGDCASSGPYFVYDVWYKYTAEAAGVFTVSSCGLVAFDQMIAFYDGAEGCVPTNDIACGDDTCDVGGGPSEVSLIVPLGKVLLIRVGGWYDPARGGDPRGAGEIIFSLEPEPDETNPVLPMPMESGTKLACTTHADCAVTPGAQGSACVSGICYNPMNTYLAIEPNNTEEVAFRVEMTDSFFHSGSHCNGPEGYACAVDEDCIVFGDGDTCILNPPGAVGTQKWVDAPNCYSRTGALLGGPTYLCNAFIPPAP